MSRRRSPACRVVDVDGMPVRIRGDREPTEGDLEVLRDFARFLASNPHPSVAVPEVELDPPFRSEPT